MAEVGNRYRRLARGFGVRGWSAVSAAGIAAGWAIVGVLLWTVVPDLGNLLIVPSLSAILIVAILGWLLGKWAAGSRSRGPLVTMAALSVVLNALLIALVLALPSALFGEAGGLLALVGVGLIFFLYGLFIFGLPALVIALPSAYVWLRLLRACFGDR
jgi:hypothetical protein